MEMSIELAKFLDTLSDEWLPVKEQLKKYYDKDSGIKEDDVIQVYRRPWIAPMNFGILLFPSAGKMWFDKFQEKTNREIPALYKQILMEMNGCFVTVNAPYRKFVK